jgi:hypothetical protein
VTIWSLLFFRAVGHYSYVATFWYPDATGVWDFWVYLPLGIALGLLLSALVFNFVLRSADAFMFLAVVAFMTLMAVLPYLVMTGGGV